MKNQNQTMEAARLHAHALFAKNAYIFQYTKIRKIKAQVYCVLFCYTKIGLNTACAFSAQI